MPGDDPYATSLSSRLSGREMHRVPIARRMWISFIAVAVSLYAPFCWLLTLDFSNSYHFHWLCLWPILPGLFAGIVFHPNDTLELFVMGMATLTMLGGLTWLGMRLRFGWLISIATALVISIPSSIVSHILFRV